VLEKNRTLVPVVKGRNPDYRRQFPTGKSRVAKEMSAFRICGKSSSANNAAAMLNRL
jgi:hypothetical protein